MDLVIQLLIYAIPFAAVWTAVHYGPVKSRWWRHENPMGCAMFLGGITFALGFFGPMLLYSEANQGPLFGIFYSGPVGTLLGLLWGISRAHRRRGAVKGR